MAYQLERYGWLPDLPDHRDYRYTAPLALLRKLPANVDLRRNCPPVYDQGALGSCTANAIGAAVQFERIYAKQLPDFVPSRLFIYYNERVLEHSVLYDAGAYLRDGMKTVARQGVCDEVEWPYDIARFAERPPAQCYTDALQYRTLKYARVTRTLRQMKGCLASGYPFVFGFTVYESFESDVVTVTGNVPMPASVEQVLGGHAVLAVGYDDHTQRFTFRNSWGARWGDQGYGTMPYPYLTNANLSDDFWTIRLESA
jgi:C1A family cysteine protease